MSLENIARGLVDSGAIPGPLRQFTQAELLALGGIDRVIEPGLYYFSLTGAITTTAYGIPVALAAGETEIYVLEVIQSPDSSLTNHPQIFQILYGANSGGGTFLRRSNGMTSSLPNWGTWITGNATVQQVRDGIATRFFVTPDSLLGSMAWGGPVSLSSGSTYSFDPSVSPNMRVIAPSSGTLTIGSPFNFSALREGMSYAIMLAMAGTATISFHSSFDFGLEGTPTPTQTTSSTSRKYGVLYFQVLKKTTDAGGQRALARWVQGNNDPWYVAP